MQLGYMFISWNPYDSKSPRCSIPFPSKQARWRVRRPHSGQAISSDSGSRITRQSQATTSPVLVEMSRTGSGVAACSAASAPGFSAVIAPRHAGRVRLRRIRVRVRLCHLGVQPVKYCISLRCFLN